MLIRFILKICLVSLLFQRSLVALEDNSILLTIPSAIQRAIECNRQFHDKVDHISQAEYKIILSENEFSWKFHPTSELGFAGGGGGKDGFTVGLGMRMDKKYPHGDCISFAPTLYKVKDNYQTNVKLSIKFPLFRRWGLEYNLAQLKGAEYSYRSAKRGLINAQYQLILKTIKLLYEVAKQEKAVLLNKGFLIKWDQYVHATEIKERMGLCDKFDYYRAENERKNVQDQLASSIEKLEEVKDSLRDFLGLPWQTEIEVQVPFDFKEFNVEEKEAIDTALCKRIEVEQSYDDYQEKMRYYRLAKNDLLPDLNLVLNFNNCGHDQGLYRSCFETVRENTWGIGFTTQSDFDKTKERISFNQSLISIQSAQRHIDQIKSTITFEVKKAIRSMERQKQKIQINQEKENNSEQEIKLVNIKYQKGLADYYEVIHAEKHREQAKLGTLNSIIDYLQSQYYLLYSMGLLLETSS